MKKIALIMAGLLVFSVSIGAAEAAERKLPIAGQQKSAPEQLPPDAIPQIPDVPPEAFSLKGDCGKEEARALDALDERLFEISDPEGFSLNRSQQETMEMLRDPDQLRKVVDLYTKCDRSPSMHEFDPETYEKDMEDLEKANRQ
jgi:hypothetical protein